MGQHRYRGLHLANRNLPDPLVIPAKPQRLAEANARIDNHIRTATQLEPPLPLADDILPRMSNQQLQNELGLVDDREADAFRVDQATAFDTNPFIAGRLDAMLRNVRDGRLTPDVDDNSNLFLNAVSSVFGGLKSGVGQAFKVIELYDRNVADPFAGGVTGLIQMLLPGEQEIERLIREKTDSGINIWSAAGEAFDESGLPGWVKLGIQLGADPLVLAGAANLIRKGAFGAVGAARLLDPGGELAFKGGRAVTRKITGKGGKALDVAELTTTVADLPDYDTMAGSLGAAATSKARRLRGLADPASIHTSDSLDGMIDVHAKWEDLGRNFSEMGVANILANGQWTKLFKTSKFRHILSSSEAKDLSHAEKTFKEGDVIQDVMITTPSGDVPFNTMWKRTQDVGARAKNPFRLSDDAADWFEDAHEVVRDAEKMVAKVGGEKLDVIPFFNAKGELADGDALMGINKYLSQSYAKAADKKFANQLKTSGLVAVAGAKGGKFVNRVNLQIADAKQAEKIEDALKTGRLGSSELNPVRAVGQFSDLLRTLRASFDMGAPLIQGLPLLFRNPVIWGKAALAHVNAFVGPGSATKRARYIKDNADIITEYIQNGGIIGSTEFFEGLNNGGWLAKLPSSLRRQTFERANRSFDTFLDMGKVEMYKALRATAGTSDQLADLANHTNKLLGTISTAALGVGRTQRELERAIIMFSPRYTRASAALLLDAFKGGMRGQQARIAMGNLLIGGMITYRAFAEVLGQEPNFDPTSGGFLKVNIHGVDVGIGGKFRSMARLYGKVFSEEQINSPQDFLKWNLFNKEDFNANPLAQWARSNGAPGAQFAMNLVIGENVLGKQIPDEDPSDWLEFAGEEAPVPFFVQAGIESGSIGQRALAAGVEFVGGTAFTPNETDILREIQDKAANEEWGMDWQKLAADQKLKVEQNHPEIEEQSVKANDQSSRFTRKREQVEYFQIRDRHDGNWVEIVNNDAAQFDSDVDNPRRGFEFRKSMSKANSNRRALLTDLNENQYPDVIKGFEERDTGDKPVFDIALREYEDLIFSALDEFGNLDYNTPEDLTNEDPAKRTLGGIDAREESLRKKWGDKTINDIKQFIKDKKSARGDLSETVLQYFDAIEVIRPYWDIWKTTLKGQDLILWTAFEALGAGQQELIRNDRSSRGSRFRLIESKVRVAKERFRAKNQEIDALLVKFWDLSPKHRQNILDKRRGL